MYDETPMVVRVKWAGSEGASESEKALHKVFTVHFSWSMLFAPYEKMPGKDFNAAQCSDFRPGDFLRLEGSCSPRLRVSDSTSGEGTYAALAASVGDFIDREASSTFDFCCRIAETDEAGGNMRCEAIAMSQLGDTWHHLHILCLCHKLHTSMAKTLQLEPAVTSGIIHACIQLGGAGAMRKL
eukprot:6473209-Amphidinium_carterae.1